MVVYYSVGGTTRLYAEVLADLLGDQPVELREKRPRSKGLGFVRGCFEALTGASVAIEDVPAPQAGKPVFVCSPIWAANLTPAVTSFVKTCNLRKCKVNVVLTCANITSREAYAEKAKRRMRALGCDTGFVQVFANPGKHRPDKQTVRKHLKKLVLNVDETF